MEVRIYNFGLDLLGDMSRLKIIYMTREGSVNITSILLDHNDKK